MKSSLAATISTFQQVAKSFHHISLNFQSHAEKRAFSQQQFKCLQQLFVMNFSKKKLDISFFFIKLWLNNRTSLDNSCMTRQTFIFFFCYFLGGIFLIIFLLLMKADATKNVTEPDCDWLSLIVFAYLSAIQKIFFSFFVYAGELVRVCVCLRAKL